jgi:glycosyltransferase involved in cell wall biosynthesis
MVVSISIVVPVYAGADYLDQLVEQASAVRAKWRGSVLNLTELIFVDDSSVDDSPAVLDRLAAEHDWIVPLHLSRNFGQHAATIAGIRHSSGDWVVTMDEDLQHPPAEIETLLREAVKTSADLIYAQPSEPVHGALSRDMTSRFYKWLMAQMGGNENIRLFNSFRLIRGPIARAAASVCGYETYLDIALSWFTDRVVAVGMVLRDDRYAKSGKSGYRLATLLSHARRLAMSSHIKIMRAAALVGATAVALSFILSVIFMLKKLFGPDIPIGWTSLAVMILFFSGLLTVLLAVVLEYISVLSMGAHGKPVFFIVDRRNDGIIRAYFQEGADAL